MRVAILTISDGCFRGRREDASGERLADMCRNQGWQVSRRDVVPDEAERIRERLSQWRDEPLDLILSTGGTGLGPRDVTPEAVSPLLDKRAEGMAELMRSEGLKKTPFAALSRSLAGVMADKVVLCLPGSPKGASESLEALCELLPHAVNLAQGRTAH